MLRAWVPGIKGIPVTPSPQDILQLSGAWTEARVLSTSVPVRAELFFQNQELLQITLQINEEWVSDEPNPLIKY